MREIIYNLAGGRGKFERSMTKVNLILLKLEFGEIITTPGSKIGKHGHYDTKKWRHCEIYLTFSWNIFVNGKRRIFSICRNSEHEAENISGIESGKIFFLKLWW